MIKIWREVTYREKQVTCNQYCDWKRNIYRTLPYLIKKELRKDAPNSWLEVPFFPSTTIRFVTLQDSC